MIILIAAGAGFIGAAVVRYAVNETEDVVFNDGKWTYAGKLGSLLFVAASNRYRFAQANICDQKWMDGIFAEFKPGG
ncbi:MAG: GDP-mannose 4,6-dehydratase [Rhizobiales bacterium]|nr:GDP-mannose 4,6-dehydratase [Hyphomicrobiales bacterium]